MTINIALHCRDGIVFGCDSLGSMVQQFLDPKTGVPVIDKKTGQPLLHPETGDPLIDVRTMKSTDVIINTLGYENKLMTIRDYPVGILTSGLGMIGSRCVEDLIGEFAYEYPAEEKLEGGFSVKVLAEKMKDYLSDLYSKEFKGLPDIKAGPRLELIIAGYSSSKYRGEIYQLSLPSGSLKQSNSDEKPYTMITGGQDDAIERFINGMERRTLNNIVVTMLNKVNTLLAKMEKHTRTYIIAELTKSGVSVPDIAPTPQIAFEEQMPLRMAAYQIPFGLFSIQNAVDFVVFLIYIVYGKQRFVVGIPTVGGKVKIAYITRHEGFKDLTPQKIDVGIFTI